MFDNLYGHPLNYWVRNAMLYVLKSQHHLKMINPAVRATNDLEQLIRWHRGDNLLAGIIRTYKSDPAAGRRSAAEWYSVFNSSGSGYRGQ